MSLAELMGVPGTGFDLRAWQFANVASHRDIIRRIRETKGLDLVEYPLQPFDPNDPASLDAFLNSHQDMHTQMDQALGLASYNLSEVDWQDPSNLAQWVQAHFIEHNAASALLGVS